jgi:microcystin-dependent protein
MNPFIGEIKMIGFNYAPKGWAFCNGQIMSIQQNQALFALLGTTFGGNGTTTFALPNLQGASPIYPDEKSVYYGQSGGEAAHTLTTTEMPPHTHQAVGANDVQSVGSPVLAYWANQQSLNAYATTGNTNMLPTAPTGQSQGHPNMQPYLAVNFVIALIGVFPSRG